MTEKMAGQYSKQL